MYLPFMCKTGCNEGRAKKSSGVKRDQSCQHQEYQSGTNVAGKRMQENVNRATWSSQDNQGRPAAICKQPFAERTRMLTSGKLPARVFEEAPLAPACSSPARPIGDTPYPLAWGGEPKTKLTISNKYACLYLSALLLSFSPNSRSRSAGSWIFHTRNSNGCVI